MKSHIPVDRRNHRKCRRRSERFLLLALPGVISAIQPLGEASPDDLVQQTEARRIRMIERVSPAVVCVLDQKLRGGGSGVLIDPGGYGLTNFHVVAGMMEGRTGWGGLGNGERYVMEILGVDVTGDVAMFRLIPPDEDFAFPFVPLADSDQVRLGDTAVAMGNPFNISEDYSPSISVGIVTGTHRYQWGVRGNLTYTNCIQVDAAINPGNSGGPLFNAQGEVIGINGRISVNTRGRFNVGFGYAISANQIRRFIPALRAGRLTRHGTWHARVDALEDKGVVFVEILKSGPSYEAGLRVGDRLMALDGVPISTANQVVSLLGTYPQNWPIVTEVQRDGREYEFVVRLDPVEPRMRRPVPQPRIVNRREVHRVFSAYQNANDTVDSPTTPDHAVWYVQRQHDDPEAGMGNTEHFAALWYEDQPVRMARSYADGSSGGIIEYDDKKAVQRAGDAAEPFDLDPEQTLTLNALYIAFFRWLAPVEQLELGGLTHIGGGVLIPAGAEPTKHIPRSPSGYLSPRTLEVIEYELSDEAKARFAFDIETHELVRIIVRDEVSGTDVSIYLSDYRKLGELKRPCTIDVYGTGYHYRDTLSHEAPER